MSAAAHALPPFAPEKLTSGSFQILGGKGVDVKRVMGKMCLFLTVWPVLVRLSPLSSSLVIRRLAVVRARHV